ncbi:MAG: hypothetical protein DRJ38_06565 [Thermoprotei archaeon]|nr:MAG: hypothetical protein DRJ38_06565 [Thermoprotei archaeon]
MKTLFKYSEAPPPPPPPPPPPSEKKKFPLLLILGIIVVVLVIGGIAAFFFFKGQLPLPIGGGEEGVPGYTTGQWVEYIVSSKGMNIEMKIEVEGFETKEGVECVKLVQVQKMPQGEMIMTIWYDPESGKVVWWKSQLKVGDQVVQENEGPGGTLPGKEHMPFTEDWGEYKGKETVKVPAGSFECDRYEKKVPRGKVIIWINTDIPITKVVKMETIVLGDKVFTMELKNYGG